MAKTKKPQLLCKYPAFAHLLAHAMSDPPITGSDLARRVGTDGSSISHFLKGHWLPRAQTLAHLIRVLHLDPARVLDAILEDAPLPPQETSPTVERSVEEKKAALLKNHATATYVFTQEPARPEAATEFDIDSDG